MGRDKALVEVGGRQMWEWVRTALEPVCERVVAAGRPDGLGSVEGLADPDDGRRGPLAGLVSALRAARSSPVMLVATDQPWVRVQTLEGLVSSFHDLPVVPISTDGSRQTTCALFPPGVLSVALDELLADGSIQSVLDRTAFDQIEEDQWRTWGEDGRSWFSVDTPDALKAGLQRYGVPTG